MEHNERSQELLLLGAGLLAAALVVVANSYTPFGGAVAALLAVAGATFVWWSGRLWRD